MDCPSGNCGHTHKPSTAGGAIKPWTSSLLIFVGLLAFGGALFLYLYCCYNRKKSDVARMLFSRFGITRCRRCSIYSTRTSTIATGDEGLDDSFAQIADGVRYDESDDVESIFETGDIMNDVWVTTDNSETDLNDYEHNANVHNVDNLPPDYLDIQADNRSIPNTRKSPLEDGYSYTDSKSDKHTVLCLDSNVGREANVNCFDKRPDSLPLNSDVNRRAEIGFSCHKTGCNVHITPTESPPGYLDVVTHENKYHVTS